MFFWGDERQCASNTLEALIQECVPLAIFDSNLPTLVTTDPSDYGLRTFFVEHQEGTNNYFFCVMWIETNKVELLYWRKKGTSMLVRL